MERIQGGSGLAEEGLQFICLIIKLVGETAEGICGHDAHHPFDVGVIHIRLNGNGICQIKGGTCQIHAEERKADNDLT